LPRITLHRHDEGITNKIREFLSDRDLDAVPYNPFTACGMKKKAERLPPYPFRQRRVASSERPTKSVCTLLGFLIYVEQHGRIDAMNSMTKILIARELQ
jgi:hypothetical protein